MAIDEKPFRDDQEPADARIRVGSPHVRAHVVPAAGKAGDLTKSDFVTSFLVAWQPVPTPPAHWIELLREAPFGTQAVRARDLHWNGHFLSIELFKESDIEAFSLEMSDWVAFANAEFVRREHTPAEEALAEAKKRADALESRLRRS